MDTEFATSLIEQLRKTTERLLDRTHPAHSLRTEVLELRSIFEKAGGWSENAGKDIADGETMTSDGMAISPTMAAMCLDDFARTVTFLRGTHAAIIDRIRDDRPVRVLYAGCGPWAPLATPLMTVFAPSAVRFTLLDIHSESIASVSAIVEALEAHDHVESIVRVDAGRHRIGPDSTPDIILVEMMRASLEAEPQVAVSGHLIRQAKDAVLIPEEISVELVLINSAREFVLDEGEPDRDRVKVGTVITVNKPSLVNCPAPNDGWLECSRLKLPIFDEERYRPSLLTTVRVYREDILEDYDSGITCPRPMSKAAKIKPGDEIDFSYRLGDRPQIVAAMRRVKSQS